MTSPGDASRSGFPRLLWGLILAWLGIAILTVVWGIPNEQNDLTDRATALLADSGLDVRFEGRDAIIHGSVDQSVLDAAKLSVRDLHGVRRVEISDETVAGLDTPQPATSESPAPTTTPPTTVSPAVLDDPTFSALYADGAFEMSGVLPNQDLISNIEAAAQERFGADVTSNLEVGDVKNPDYLVNLADIFTVADGLDPWSFSIDPETVAFGGMGESADALAQRTSAFEVFASANNLGDVDIAVEINPDAVAASLTDLLAEGANFETGSAILSEDAAARLSTVTAILLANPSTVVTVEGHTDDQGDADANQILSEQRAQAVVDYLTAGGVGAERLQAIGYGEERPIADNDTEEGRAINRRIEFVVSEGDQP